MRSSKRFVGILGLLGVCAALSACAYNPFDLVANSLDGGGAAPQQVSQVATASAVAATSTAQPSVVPVKFAKSPTPPPADPLLASGSWGYHDKIDKDDSESSALRQNILRAAYDKLTVEQQSKLLRVFRHSSKVDNLIENAGGDIGDVTYSATEVSANDDASYGTPWVTARLRADFPTDGGLKRVECYVYRQKTHKGLDNRPLVSATLVGYVGQDGEIWNPVQKRL